MNLIIKNGISLICQQCDFENVNTTIFDKVFGADNWAFVDELPDDFMSAEYELSEGKLVRASAKLIAEREAAAVAAYNEQQRALREAQYRATTDPLVIEAMAESNPEIKALKDEIRAKYPYK